MVDLKVVAGTGGTLQGYYAMLFRIGLELDSGLRLLGAPSDELTECAVDVELAMERLRTAVVSQALMSGELKW